MKLAGTLSEHEAMAQISARARGTGEHWISRAVFRLDAWLRRRYQVYEYSQDPRCIFRIQLATAAHDIVLADGTAVRPGERILDLHFWNEQFPCFLGQGATLSWACRISRDVEHSLEQLAEYLGRTPHLRDIKAVRADARLSGRQMTPQLIRICARYGFETGPQVWLARGLFIRRLGEDILILLLVLARNSKALRPTTVRRQSVQIFLSRAVLDSRYGRTNFSGAQNRLELPDDSIVSQPELPADARAPREGPLGVRERSV
jgi:YkoP domain